MTVSTLLKSFFGIYTYIYTTVSIFIQYFPVVVVGEDSLFFIALIGLPLKRKSGLLF